MLNNMWQFWRQDYFKAWRNLEFQKVISSFNRIMTPSIPLKELKGGLRSKISSFWIGLHNLLTSIPLNTLGIISKGASQAMKMLLQKSINYV